MEDLKEQILEHLSTPFEKDLLNASFENLADKKNKLRLNNFAYSMRELTRHFLDRLAPDEEIKKSPWYEPVIVHGKETITRQQRIKYAIQGWLNDEYLKIELKIDYSDISKNLLKSINELSKYTHINPETFNIKEDETEECVADILTNTLSFFKAYQECRNKVKESAKDRIDEQMVKDFYTDTLLQIDEICSHHEIQDYEVVEIIVKSMDDENILLWVKGSINVLLQYGSSYDLRHDDGIEIQESFPFTSNITVSYKNEDGVVHIVDSNIEIDTGKFYDCC